MSETYHGISGPTRDSQIYISWNTVKGLIYVPRDKDVSPDALAEQILSDWLKANHKNIVEHIEKQRQEDKAFRDSLKKVPFT
jgi:hypothetical protein